MNNEQLKLFISIVENGSFSKAEKENYISKQAMMKQINNLESEVGCELLERNRKGIRLTQAGSIFYNGAVALITQMDQLIQQCKNVGSENLIRVGSVEHQVLLNPVNEAYAKLYPNIKIERAVHPNHSGEYRVEHRIIDVGETYNIDNMIAHMKFDYTKLCDFEYCAVMDKHHPLARNKELTLKQLTGYRTIAFPLMMSHAYISELQKTFKSHEGNLILSDEVDRQIENLFSCINTKQIVIMANPVSKSIDGLVTVPLSTHWSVEYGIIYKAPVSKAVRQYIDLAVTIYSKK